ncbi:putative transporter C1683,12 [Rhizoctonia solani AG-1 IB]|uniref:Putative transporter C1683,12 n=1 Tax=Thanatephorus cucumeris (strain AG1-IB / isolate 7/3/14) TaxID=1108050 RepID=M5BZW8_THACB|nr:putative transporter C1683,12 [Rhizoctonia solani AG-1 IB]
MHLPALHYAAQNASTLVLEKILEYEHPLHEGEGGCDVDLQNRIYGYTPLHLAVRIEDAEERLTVVESLLDAGADDTIKDKKGQRAIDAVPADDEDVRRLFRQAEASRKVDNRDIADVSHMTPLPHTRQEYDNNTGRAPGGPQPVFLGTQEYDKCAEWSTSRARAFVRYKPELRPERFKGLPPMESTHYEVAGEKGVQALREKRDSVHSIETGIADSGAGFTPEDSKRVLSKLDRRILPWMAGLFLLSYLDRSNIGNARLDGLEKDLGLRGLQFNNALAIFYPFYVISEVPSNMMLKRTRASFWFAFLMVSWGTIMTLMGLVKNYTGLMIARAFLGIAEGGLFPGIAFYITLWYPRSETGSRMAIYYAAVKCEEWGD